MKKTKLLLLVAALLVFVTMFNACGSMASVKSFLNEEYDPSNELFTSESAIAELTDYTLTDQSNDNFAIFASETPETISYKVFSFKANAVIATLADTASLFTFELFDEVPLLLVAKVAKPAVPVEDDSSSVEIDVTYTAYDAQGENLKTFEKYKPNAPKLVTFNSCIFDYAAYTIGNDGSLSKTVDIPEYVILNDSFLAFNDDYYYAYDDSAVYVYDHSFNIVSSYIAPSYYKNLSTSVLNNGDILAQYVYEVDEDERKYDLSFCNGEYEIGDGKFNLVSLIITAKNGKAKEVNLDYVVNTCINNYDLNNYYKYMEEDSPYTEDFENIAIISPIVNKKIDGDIKNADLVFMNNKGKALDSLKVLDDQLPVLDSISKIGNDRYIVYTLSGASIIDAKGNIIKNMNNDALTLKGNYFESSRAIYDLDLNNIYDLIEKDASVIGFIGNTIFVQAETEKGYEIISFCNGDQKTIHTYDNTVADGLVFELVNGIGYVLINTVSNSYEYYNAEGKLILTTTYKLIAMSSTDSDVVIMKSADASTYHMFSK